MPILHAIILGITQGLSEFLPISSSGHLILVPWLFGWDELTRNPELNKSFDVALHVGTFVGALAYFRLDVVRIVEGALGSLRKRAVETPDERLAWLLVLSTVPAALVGVLFEGFIEERLGDPWLIGVMLIVFGLVLWWADRLPERRPEDAWRARDAVLMGVAQALALQPGVSRSGVTMSMARWLGFDRAAAARLSFLMSIPVIAGAVLLSVGGLVADGGVPPGFGPAFFWGIVASAITGFIAVWLLLKAIRRLSLLPYVAYRVVAGTAVIAIYLAR